jgi:hypothetical protein
MSIFGFLIGLPNRIPAGPGNTISNISAIRWDELINQFGGYDNETVSGPNWGQGLWSLMMQYPDYVGPIAYVILFAMPFVMMWITHADMVPAAIVGVFFGLYVAFFVGDAYFWVGIVLIALAITTVGWSLYQRRG